MSWIFALTLSIVCQSLSRHTTTKTENEGERRLLLDVVIRKRAAVLKLLPCEDETLLVRRYALFQLDIVDGVRRLDLEGDRLACKDLCADLHTTTETKDYRGVNEKVTDLYNTLCIPRWRVDSFWML